MRLIGWIVVMLGAVGVAGYAVVAYTLFPVGSLVHPEMQAAYAVHRGAILTHIFCSALAMLIGPWQFVGAIRARRPRLHRTLGRAYLGLGVLPGGVAGLYMALYAFGGAVSHVGFALLALLWLLTGARAYQAARARDFRAHGEWMVRNFALTLAALTLRIQLGLGGAAGLAFESTYPLLAWTSWIPNVLVAEWLVRARRRTGPTVTGAPAG